MLLSECQGDKENNKTKQVEEKSIKTISAIRLTGKYPAYF